MTVHNTDEFVATKPAGPEGGAPSEPKAENPRATLLSAVFGLTYDGPVDCRQYGERRTKSNYHALENDRTIGNVFVDHEGMTYCVVIETTVYNDKLIDKDSASAFMRQENKRVVCYRLETPVPNDDAKLKSITNLVAVNGMTRVILVSMPAMGGLQLYKASPSNTCSLDDLLEMLAPAEQGGDEQKAKTSSGKSSDAKSSKKSSSTPPPDEQEDDEADDDEPSGNAAVQKIRDAIAALPMKPDKTLVEPIIAAIVKLDDDYYTEQFLEELNAKKVKMPQLRRMLATAKRMASGGSLNLSYDEKGRAVFQYHARYNDDNCLELLQIALKQRNTHWRGNGRLIPQPFLTCMLQTPMVKKVRGGVTSFVPVSADAFDAEVAETFLLQNVEGSARREHVDKKFSSKAFHTGEDYLDQTPELVMTPVFGPDWTLIHKPDWYRGEHDGLAFNIYLPESNLEVPEVSLKHSAADMKKALGILRDDLLGDFPFYSLDDDGKERREPGLANALAMLITPYVRRGIDGHTPMYFVSKPVPGTGGTLLGKLPMLIEGKEFAPIKIGNNEEENAKALVSAIMDSRSCMFFDNVKKNFNSPHLLQALTGRKIGGRLLGHNQIIERDNNYLWVATGNNPIIWEEMARRLCRIPLNAKTPNVRKRKFKHKLEKWVKDNRADIIWALLTLVQSWIANGKVRFTERTMLSFEEWAEIVGGILQNAGITGFLDMPELVAMDADQNDARQFVTAWVKQYPLRPVTPEKPKRQTDFVSMKDLAWLASKEDLAVWTGKSDDDKREKFAIMLGAIEGRTFPSDVNGKGLMVQKTVTKDFDTQYLLEEVEIPADE